MTMNKNVDLWTLGLHYLTRARLEPVSDPGKAVLDACCVSCPGLFRKYAGPVLKQT